MRKAFILAALLFDSALAVNYTVTIDSGLKFENVRIGIVQPIGNGKYKDVVSKRTDKLTASIPAGRYEFVIFKQFNSEFETYLGSFNLNKNLVIKPNVKVFPTSPEAGRNFYNQIAIDASITTTECPSGTATASVICGETPLSPVMVKALALNQSGGKQLVPWSFLETQSGPIHLTKYSVNGSIYTFSLFPIGEKLITQWAYEGK